MTSFSEETEDLLFEEEDDEYLLTDSDLDEYETLMRVESAYQNFEDFIRYTMPGYIFNWHHMAMINRLDKLMGEKNKRIMIFMPPRHGKSELVSRRFPAFFLGQYPNAQIISTSYSAALASSFCIDTARIMESKEYHDIFPDTLIPNTPYSRDHPDNSKYKRTTSFFEVIGGKGHLNSSGVGGPITGYGTDLLIIDDPVKNQEEAMSETYRENVFKWYNSTAYTRLEGGANIIICQTRWHKGDLSGKLIEEMGLGGEQWEIIEFPAIRTAKEVGGDPRNEGQALWETKYPIDRLEVIKRQVGSQVWSSLYQQSPVIEGGNLIKEADIQYYQTLPFDINSWREAYLVTSWDLSFKKAGASYVVGVVIAKYKMDYYLIDIWRKKAGIVETQTAVKQMADKYRQCRTVLIEDRANGSAILDLLKSQVPYMVPVLPTTSKDERVVSIQPIFESGHFYLPMNHPMTKVIVDELISFPTGDSDDICDAISQGLNHFMTLKGLRALRAITKW